MKKCKICQNEIEIIDDKQMGWIFHKCPECLFISKDKRFIVDEKKELIQYNLHNNSLENDGYVKMFEEFIKHTISPFKKKGDVLEFGCGPGPVLAHLLEQKNYNTTKYDKYFFPKEDFKQKQYDIITSTEVIEHLDEPLYYFELFISLMKKDGILSLMTLFHTNNDEDFLKWWYRKDPTHISFYHPKTFKYIANKYQLNIIYIDKKNSLTFSLS